MRLRTIQLDNFRNHRSLVFSPEEGINLLYGPNGSGKTSVLDAVHFCALTKGFVSSSERDCLRFSSDFFSIKAIFSSGDGRDLEVRVTYTDAGEKVVAVNNADVKPFSRHVGTIPCITFSPQEIIIVNGPPSERRRFLDNAISQYRRRYLDDLLHYRRILQQRNALLAGGVQDLSTLDPWTENLARLASSITHHRLSFLSDLSHYCQLVYPLLANGAAASLQYRSSLGTLDASIKEEILFGLYMKRFELTRRHEFLRRQTLSGPHRDDVALFSDGRDIRRYASQGQMRTFLIALKLSLHRYFSERFGETPLCLFDDLFSELDTGRVEAVLSLLQKGGQSIISSTDAPGVEGVSLFPVMRLSGAKKRQ